jgi:hypothetical protein
LPSDPRAVPLAQDGRQCARQLRAVDHLYVEVREGGVQDPVPLDHIADRGVGSVQLDGIGIDLATCHLVPDIAGRKGGPDGNQSIDQVSH